MHNAKYKCEMDPQLHFDMYNQRRHRRPPPYGLAASRVGDLNVGREAELAACQEADRERPSRGVGWREGLDGSLYDAVEHDVARRMLLMAICGGRVEMLDMHVTCDTDRPCFGGR